MTMLKILVVNVGCTSLKFHLYDMQGETLLIQGNIERIGAAHSSFTLQFHDRPRRSGEAVFQDHESAIRHILRELADPEHGVLESLRDLVAVGFKPIHARDIGGAVLVNKQVIRAMEDYIPLAPAHNPPYINAMSIFRELLPDKPLVGVFEPAFHTTIPEYARLRNTLALEVLAH